jgi:hypothetical protein
VWCFVKHRMRLHDVVFDGQAIQETQDFGHLNTGILNWNPAQGINV